MSQQPQKNHFKTPEIEKTEPIDASLGLDLINTTEQQITYAEKTNRILALSQFLKSITPFIWATVILIVIIPLIGRGLIGNSISNPVARHSQPESNVVFIFKNRPTEIDQINQALVTAINNAHTSTENFATHELDIWVEQLMTRIDSSFLNWYFNYFNQKKMEFSVPFVWLYSAVTHKINHNSLTPGEKVAEKFTEDFQREFANRVLIPKAAQLKLEGLTQKTVDLYVTELSRNIDQIQSSYQIPQGQWERYLDDIAFTINGSGGIVSNLSLKFLTGGSSYLFAKAMIPTVGKVGSSVATLFAGKAAAKMAAKTGGAVAAKVGAQFLDPIVAVGIIIWDVWDYNHTVEVSKPVLREALWEYLQQVKLSLLQNPESGIMAVINQVEDGIYKSIAANQPT